MPQKTRSTSTYLLSGLTLTSCILSITKNNIYKDVAWANALWLDQGLNPDYFLIALWFLTGIIGIVLSVLYQKTYRFQQKKRLIHS